MKKTTIASIMYLCIILIASSRSTAEELMSGWDAIDQARADEYAAAADPPDLYSGWDAIDNARADERASWQASGYTPPLTRNLMNGWDAITWGSTEYPRISPAAWYQHQLAQWQEQQRQLAMRLEVARMFAPRQPHIEVSSSPSQATEIESTPEEPRPRPTLAASGIVVRNATTTEQKPESPPQPSADASEAEILTIQQHAKLLEIGIYVFIVGVVVWSGKHFWIEVQRFLRHRQESAIQQRKNYLLETKLFHKQGGTSHEPSTTDTSEP